MWDGVTTLGTWQDRDQVIYEGPRPVIAVILNAGPSQVRLRAWKDWTSGAGWDGPPPNHDLEMRMESGQTRAICGTLVTAGLAGAPATQLGAALAWRLVV